MTLQRCNVRDLFSLTSRKMTDEGYLVAPAKVARTGIQVYAARELGLDKTKGMDGNARVRLLRPREEVFSAEAMASFDRKPIADDHPPEGVTAANWAETAVGDVHDPVCAGETMDMEVIVRDPGAIKHIRDDGKVQLSAGYGFDLDMTPGTTADGQAYDGIMRNIRGNHVAIVDYARGGSALRIADRHPNRNTGDQAMPLILFTRDGISLQLEDKDHQLLTNFVGGMEKTVKAAQDSATAEKSRADAADKAIADEKAKSNKLVADHAAEVAGLKAQIPSAEQQAALAQVAKMATDHAAEIKALKAQIPTHEQIVKMATDYAVVVDDAICVIPTFKPEGKTAPVIRAEILAGVIAANDWLKHVAQAGLGGVEPAKAAEDVARIAFDTVVAAHRSRGGDNAESRRGTINDPIVARALATDRDHRGSDAAPAPISGRALLTYREQNAGKDPNKATA